MSHPLLTKVLERALRDGLHESRQEADGDAPLLRGAIPPDIADRLEKALVECQYPGCTIPIPAGHTHAPDTHEPEPWCHTYQPLVEP